METYSDITKPLRQLTRLGKHFHWDETCRVSFQRLKKGRLREELQKTEYKMVFKELTWTKGVFLKGPQLVLPKNLRAAVIALALATKGKIGPLII